MFFPETDPTNAQAIAERIRWRVSYADFRLKSDRVPLSVSVGGATFKHAVAFDDLFKKADAAMYAAKYGGRNRVEFAVAA